MVLMVLFWLSAIAGPKIRAQITGSFRQLYCDLNQWRKTMEDVVLALENYGRGTEKDREAHMLETFNSG